MLNFSSDHNTVVARVSNCATSANSHPPAPSVPTITFSVSSYTSLSTFGKKPLLSGPVSRCTTRPTPLLGVTLIVHEPLPMIRVRVGADGALAVALTNPRTRQRSRVRFVRRCTIFEGRPGSLDDCDACCVSAAPLPSSSPSPPSSAGAALHVYQTPLVTRRDFTRLESFGKPLSLDFNLRSHSSAIHVRLYVSV
jgi:hypothetical protein